MDAETKHGLPKVVALADKLARLVMDQLAKDGCANLENIRNALVGPLAHDEMDRQDERMRLAEKHAKARDQWEAAGRLEKGFKKLAEGITEELLRGPTGNTGPVGCDGTDMADALAHGLGAYWIGIDPAKQEFQAPIETIQLWAVRHGPNGPEGRYNVAPTRQLLNALGNALASGKAQRVSINDGTYVMPDGEVLSEVEMIKRGGINGR